MPCPYPKIVGTRHCRVLYVIFCRVLYVIFCRLLRFYLLRTNIPSSSLLLTSHHPFHTHSSHAQCHHSHAENCYRL